MMWRNMAIAFGVLLVVSSAYMLYISVRGKTLDEVRVMCYRLILQAEKAYKEHGKGREKMRYVIEHLYNSLPKFATDIIPMSALEDLCQIWFDEVKDFLDNGKMDGSTHETP